MWQKLTASALAILTLCHRSLGLELNVFARPQRLRTAGLCSLLSIRCRSGSTSILTSGRTALGVRRRLEHLINCLSSVWPVADEAAVKPPCTIAVQCSDTLVDALVGVKIYTQTLEPACVN